jgi:hypothetical protein
MYKWLIKISLLFVMGFSILHGMVINSNEHEHHIVEHIETFENFDYEEDNHCQTHSLYHLPFLMPQTLGVIYPIDKEYMSNKKILVYFQTHPKSSFKPPII